MSPPANPPLDPTEILLGINNGPGIYVAPEGTPPPTDLVTAWPAAWIPLGYLSDDGPTLSSSTNSDTLTPWQSTSPVRTVITGKELTLQFIMWQTNPQSLALYFDMVAPVVADGEDIEMDISSSGGGVIYAVGLDIKDGDIITRITFPRAQLSDSGDVSFTRGAAVGWDVTLSALDSNGILGHLMSGTGAGTGGTQSAKDKRHAEAAA